MSLLTRIFRSVTVLACTALPASMFAQVSVTSAHPHVRVLSKVDAAVRTTLQGNVPAVVANGTIGSRLNGSTQLNHLILMLKPSDDQVAALHTLLDAQQDKNSPSFHKWLTPETFGQSFGVADADIAKVAAWLQDNGMSVEQISQNRRIIQFGGPASAVEAAFATEFHNLTVDGEAHVSNTVDISVPIALAPVVMGVARLNDFHPRSNARMLGTLADRRVAEAGQNGGVAPDYGVATGTHYVAPGDVAKIFNATPLLSAANPIDGTGVTIAVLARSNIDVGDVTAFRSMFGLPVKNPTVTVVGDDPGKNGDDTEAYLDAEWAGAVAPNANVNFIVSGISLFGGDIDASALYAVDNNIGDIISLSYGGCERNNGQSGTAFWQIVWEQAAAQGQTAMVSSGDSGAAGCDSSSATYATGGYGINALGTSAYNVSVGGSMFVDYGPTQYWSATGTTIPFANALSYIPEAALNQSRLTTTLLNSASTGTSAGSGIFSGGGGISIFTPRPSWQTGSGISATADPTDYQGNAVPLTGSTVTGLHRLSPDVSLISANGHDGTLFCAGGICRTTSTGTLGNAGIVGGTSVATPVMASAQALINQKNGGRQGNANIYYYRLANNQYTASTTACQGTNGTAAVPTVVLPAATCNFQDIVAGSIVVPTAGSGTAGIGFAAGAGYDAATGLGSVNIANVANNWSSVTFNATATTLSLTPTSGISHGATQTATINVTAASGTGTPTGDVSLIASIASSLNGYSAPQVFVLNNGSVNGTLNSLPAGTYTVYAHYAGDTTYASSNSAPVTVTIAKEDSTTSLQDYYLNSNGSLTQTATFPYATNLISINALVSGGSGNGNPGGSVVFNVSRNGTTLPSLTQTLDASSSAAYLQSGVPLFTYYVPNYATLAPGNYTVTANYAGDDNFNASAGTTTFTVTQAKPTLTLTAPAQITAAQTTLLTLTVNPPSAVAAAASGTITFVDTTTNVPLGTATIANGTASLSTNLIVTSGAHTITATYGGDTNYATNTTTTTVSVGTGTAPAISVAASGTLTVGATVTLTATLATAPASSSTVSFYDGAVLLGTVTATTTSPRLNYAAFIAGTHTITALFSGNATQASSTSAATNVTIAKNTTAVAITAGPITQTYGNVALSGSITRTPNTTAAPAVPLTGTVSVYDIAPTPAVLLGTAVPTFDPAGYSTYAFSFTSGSALAPGTHTIQVTYSGDANYNGSTAPNTPTLTVAKSNPVATAMANSIVYGTASTTLTGTLAYSANPAPTGSVTLGVDGGPTVAATCTGTASPLTCVASNYNASTVTAGAHTVTLSYAGDTNYNSAVGTAAFTVTKATPTITFTVPNHTYGDAAFTVSASSPSTGAITYSVVSGPATISGGNTVTITGVGTVVLLASQAADANYVATTQRASFTVAPGTAAITFTVPNHLFGDAPFTVSASSVSTGAFTYSVVSGPATISGNTVTLTGAGTVVLLASQAADANYVAGSKQATFTAGVPAVFDLKDNGAGSIELHIARGKSATTTLTVSPSVTFAGVVALSCTSVPANASCSFATPTLTFTTNGAAQTSTLTVSTNSQIASSTSPAGMRIIFAFAFPGLLLVGFRARNRKRFLSQRLMAAVLLAIGLAGAATLTGCGSDSDSNNSTPKGTYLVNVAATSGAQTKNLSVIVYVE